MALCTVYFCFPVAPSITTLDPQDFTVTSPTPATFTCNATGRPRPTIQWYRVELDGNLTQLSNSGSLMIREMLSGMRDISSVLDITRTRLSDAADYVCEATNVVDSDEMMSTLIVYGKRGG